MKVEILSQGKPEVCEKVLRALPDWFGIEESTKAYIEESKKMPMAVATIDGEANPCLLMIKSID